MSRPTISNNVDPDGTYGRGAGFTDQEWKKFDRAQQAAAKSIEKTAARIDKALATGKGLKSVTKTFGKGSDTVANMSQVSGELKGMASVLRDDGSGGNYATGLSTADYIKAGGSQDGLAGVQQINGVYQPGVLVNIGHQGFNVPSTLRGATAHESAHNIQLPHGQVNGATAYKNGSPAQQQAFRDLPLVNPPAALTNPDHLVDFVW